MEPTQNLGGAPGVGSGGSVRLSKAERSGFGEALPQKVPCLGGEGLGIEPDGKR